MALLLLSGGSLAQHRRGAAPGLPASTQDRGQTYASLPQATQPLLLPPTPRTPGEKHPPSHVRFLDTPLKATARVQRQAQQLGFAPGPPRGGAPSFLRPGPLGAAPPATPEREARALEQLVPELLRRLGSLQGAPPSLGRMLQATALARLQPPATAPRNGVDPGVRRAALPALLDQMPLGADAKARMRAAEPALYAPAPAPRPPPSFRRPAAATPEPEVLGLLRGDGRDARALRANLGALVSSGAGASRERSVFAAAADALRGVAPATRQQLALPGLRPAPPLEAASASDPAARVHNLLAPLLEVRQARAQVDALRRQMAAEGSPLEPKMHSPGVPDWLQPE